MTNRIIFMVDGQPATAGSKVSFINPKTNRIITKDDCKRGPQWRDDVQKAARPMFRNPLVKPIVARATFLLHRPKRHYGTGKNAQQLLPTAPKYHTQVPDATKLWRAAEDALKGIAWLDDGQVVEEKVKKQWACRYTERQGVVISIEEVLDG